MTWQSSYSMMPTGAGALGYHDLTKGGAADLERSSSSHTADNALVASRIDRAVRKWSSTDCQLGADAADGVEYRYEMCDPVERTRSGFDGIEMSNCVHPSGSSRSSIRTGPKFDHAGL